MNRSSSCLVLIDLVFAILGLISSVFPSVIQDTGENFWSLYRIGLGRLHDRIWYCRVKVLNRSFCRVSQHFLFSGRIGMHSCFGVIFFAQCLIAWLWSSTLGINPLLNVDRGLHTFRTVTAAFAQSHG